MTCTVSRANAIEYIEPGDASTLVILAEPQACPVCRAAHLWFINRDGSTVCVACDAGRACSEEFARAESSRMEERATMKTQMQKLHKVVDAKIARAMKECKPKPQTNPPRSIAEALRMGFRYLCITQDHDEDIPDSWPLPTMGDVEALLVKEIEPGVRVCVSVPFKAKYTFGRPSRIWTEDDKRRKNHAA